MAIRAAVFDVGGVRAIFRLTEDRLGVKPNEIVFLDDNEDAVTGAKRRGWHAVLHRDTGVSIRDIKRLVATA
jgi:FMN phosphatase YigB (HAD superfamily)